MIKKSHGKYVVMSEHTGRKFGTYKTKKEALARLRQIEFFKHLKRPGIKTAGMSSRGCSATAEH